MIQVTAMILPYQDCEDSVYVVKKLRGANDHSRRCALKIKISQTC